MVQNIWVKVAIVVEDKYEILTEWFSFTYLFLGCALPTVATSMETVAAMRWRKQSV